MIKITTSRYCGYVLNSFVKGNMPVKETIFKLACNSKRNLINRYNTKSNLLEKEIVVKQMPKLLHFKDDSDIIYSTVLESYKHTSFSFKEEITKELQFKRKMETLHSSMPISIQRIINEKKLSNVNAGDEEIPTGNISTNDHIFTNNFPFGKFQDINIKDCNKMVKNLEPSNLSTNIPKLTVAIKDDITYRLKTYNERKKKQKEDNITDIADNSEIYEDSLLSNVTDTSHLEFSRRPIYGTPNPEIDPSSVPCGGCGALLHCQEESLPGYLPSELFKDKNNGELRHSLCQRCFFLETYDVALNVRVSPDVYENSLQPIIADKALVIVVVDILDIPCSIWPGLFKLLGPHRPVFIVGNKVDLLPPDSANHLLNVRKSFLTAVKKTNLMQLNIKHVALTSAKTGYGIEDLISKLQVLWGTKGNIYIVGCTNAGKSTLFNAFLGSDMCQNQASDLIRRSTTSPWPGTTLNLLKFPLMKPTGERITRRLRRLQEEKLKGAESLPPAKRLTSDFSKATLTGHIGRTFIHDAIQHESGDPFVLNAKKSSFVPMGINDQSYLFKESKWLFDTPGTVQPDQLLGLLTHNELLQVLPRNIIEPRTYSLRYGQSLFLGGLARLDVLFISHESIRLTVFSSINLPVTIVNTVNASNFYRNYLGTKLFNVPEGGPERLIRWPSLKPVNIFFNSLAPEGESCADIVLSSAGFIAVTGKDEIELRGWTPSGRGVYIRDPPMVPMAVKLKGKRIKGTPAYHKHQVYIPSAFNKL